jgi:hypothetical protein|nr:MAG: hypothetical protein DIU52_06280 [bacterium]
MEVLIAVLMAAVAVAAVLPPFVARGRAARAASGAGGARDDGLLEAEIARYREALRAGTVCEHCTFANPPGSRYCADCGRRLPAPGTAGAAAGPA